MKNGELDQAREQYDEIMKGLRDGTVVAAFTVAIGRDDMAYTYFTGEDGEEQTAGLLAFDRIYRWLVGMGVVASPGEMVEIGNELHLEPE